MEMSWLHFEVAVSRHIPMHNLLEGGAACELYGCPNRVEMLPPSNATVSLSYAVT